MLTTEARLPAGAGSTAGERCQQESRRKVSGTAKRLSCINVPEMDS